MFLASPAIGEDGTVYFCTRGENWTGTGYRSNGRLHALGELDPDAPLAPIIDGPERIKTYEEYEYTFKTTSPLGKDVYYWIEWGDKGLEEWIGPYESGEEITVSHEWHIYKKPFKIIVKAKDVDERWGPWGEFEVKYINRPPEAPTIKGKALILKPGTYNYKLEAIDPDDDDIRFLIDWRDGNYEWTDYYPSGEEIIINHSWYEKKWYLIRARANDTNGVLGPWGYIQTSKFDIIEIGPNIIWFLERYPLLQTLFLRLGLQ